MAHAGFDKARAFLQAKQGDTSLYDHLSEVLLKLVTEEPADAVAKFEHISSLVKQGAFPQGDPYASAGGAAEAGPRSEAALARATAAQALFATNEEEEAGEPVQDLTDDMNYLEWAGVSIGREEAFRLHLSLRRLAATQPVRQLRFWGRVLGTGGDYLVAECSMDAEDDEEDATDSRGNTIEKTGEGVNKYTYFVATSAGGAWTKLPNATPEQVVVAGQIRRFFTGNLDAAVGGHPPFPGNEAAYLRAVIARISADTVVSPAGIYKQVEDEEAFDVELNEDEEDPFSAVDLTDGSNWVHHHAPINVLGRTRPNPPALNDDGEEIEDENAPAPGALLGAIGEDTMGGGEEEGEEEEEGGAWAIRRCPATGAPSGGDETTIMAAAKSLKWPGAVAVGLGKRFVNAYVGYGLPVARTRYQPVLPAAVGVEYNVEEEGQELKEGEDVTADPDEGKEADEDEEED